MKGGLVFGFLFVAGQNSFAIVAAPIGGTTPVDSTFTFVGEVNGASAVAIGPRTVLTANHVGTANFVLNGTTYTVFNSVVGPVINGQVTDLLLINLNQTLPGYYNVGNGFTLGSTITMVGYGGTGVVNATQDGYALTGGVGIRRHGDNTIDDAQFVDTVGPSLLSYLAAAPDAALVSGDSGGGWFSNGQLVGINNFIFNLSYDPNTQSSLLPDYGFANRNTNGFTIPGTSTFVPANTPYFGSGAVDVTDPTIRQWITANAVPEPASVTLLVAGIASLLARRRRK